MTIKSLLCILWLRFVHVSISASQSPPIPGPAMEHSHLNPDSALMQAAAQAWRNSATAAVGADEPRGKGRLGRSQSENLKPMPVSPPEPRPRDGEELMKLAQA